MKEMRKLEALPVMTQRAVRDLPKLPDGREYLVMAPNVWQRDPSPAVALKEAIKRASRVRKNQWAVVFRVPADAHVDEMGMMRWKDAKEPVEEVARVAFKKS